MQIALLCVQENAKDRPFMLEVSSMLKNENAEMAIPKWPAFASRNEYHDQGPEATSRPDTSSVNDATISEVVAR
ncbi:hypothetical protein PanWU01x14_338490 [Parasponia andersonii]|uniref:Tyrosine-protein kinase n=1 Tax=Parasponia andersonii TaxID=3476 RepID=A0A2P5AF50_PARAD|nr:hypothetical protein PanWU01x14_338490 [Parasponia andersonii]